MYTRVGNIERAELLARDVLDQLMDYASLMHFFNLLTSVANGDATTRQPSYLRIHGDAFFRCMHFKGVSFSVKPHKR